MRNVSQSSFQFENKAAPLYAKTEHSSVVTIKKSGRGKMVDLDLSLKFAEVIDMKR